jgi:hypothetical protein
MPSISKVAGSIRTRHRRGRQQEEINKKNERGLHKPWKIRTGERRDQPPTKGWVGESQVRGWWRDGDFALPAGRRKDGQEEEEEEVSGESDLVG